MDELKREEKTKAGRQAGPRWSSLQIVSTRPGLRSTTTAGAVNRRKARFGPARGTVRESSKDLVRELDPAGQAMQTTLVSSAA